MGFFKKTTRGNALILTMFILTGMLIVALSGSYIIIIGIKASGVQAQSTRAYFGAEAGAERLLWELRQNGYYYATPSWTSIFDGSMPTTNVTYNVYFSEFPPLVFTAIGDYQNTKRSVEIRI